MNTTNTKLDSSKNEYLSFQLGQEKFCLDILRVQEIRGYAGVTSIANTPDYIKGVVNLRGEVVPILDLRIRLRFEQAEYNAFTVVIVIKLAGHHAGIVVDGVSDVVALNADQIQDLPGMISNVNTQFITGVVNIDSQTFLLLDIERLLNKEELNFTESLH